MKTTRNILIASAALSLLSACGSTTPTVGTEGGETDTFRQALPAADDVTMDYDREAGAANGLEGDYALIAGMTAKAVIGTNAHMIGHFAVMNAIANRPPAEEGQDYRVWQGQHDDITVRVRAERSDTPRGTRYDYVVAGKLTADANADFLPVIDGHVVRLDEAYQPRDGFGIVRFHLDNANTLDPDRQQDGKIRVAFRKANRAHQVRVHAVGVETPDDPNFPKAAAYEYVVRPNESGALRWFSNGDVKQDGAPYENVAVHSAWRADKSGIGSALVLGGSLDVDYWHLAECWDSRFVKGFDRLATPDFTMNSGDPASCFNSPDDLEEPAIDENMADVDPEIPAALPEEQNGN